jgi:very-short-patch-repair endonuclease
MRRRVTINNQKHLQEYRRLLRKSLTPSEARLWLYLQKRQLEGKRFRRQFSIGNYILDFYCPEQKIAIELDGKHHFTPAGVMVDGERDAFLSAQGITVLRFENVMVLMQVENVLENIRQHFR